MFNQDRTNDALGLLKRMTDDIEESHKAATLQKKEAVHVH